MPETSLLRQLMQYVRFHDSDLVRLRQLEVHAAPHFTRIAREFYDRIRETPQASEVLQGEAQVIRLQASLVGWLTRLLTHERDEAYVLGAARIGQVHVKVGLGQQFVFGAMALIHQSLDAIVNQDAFSRDPVEQAGVRSSLIKAIDIELAIMLETYRENFVARLERVDQVESERLGRALARTERRYQSAVESAPFLVVGLDRFARVAFMNREASRVTGYAADEALDKPLDELFGLESSIFPEVLTRALTSSETVGLAVEARTRSQIPRLLEMDVTKLVGAESTDDEPLVAFAIGRDCTEERMLAQRTRQAERLAAVGTLAAGLAHEIRNPLHGARLHVTYLKRAIARSAVDPTVAADLTDAAEVIDSEIVRLSNLVTEFLEFARPKPLERKPTSLHALCARARSLIAVDGDSPISLQLDLPDDDLELSVDEPKLTQVLLNLLRNAVEALEQTGGTVTLRARKLPYLVRIEVEDDGPGLAKGAPIFDAFFSTKPQGTGLGLPIVHRIIQDHSGTLDVESSAGRTVFRVELPR